MPAPALTKFRRFYSPMHKQSLIEAAIALNNIAVVARITQTPDATLRAWVIEHRKAAVKTTAVTPTTAAPVSVVDKKDDVVQLVSSQFAD